MKEWFEKMHQMRPILKRWRGEKDLKASNGWRIEELDPWQEHDQDQQICHLNCVKISLLEVYVVNFFVELDYIIFLWCHESFWANGKFLLLWQALKSLHGIFIELCGFMEMSYIVLLDD